MTDEELEQKAVKFTAIRRQEVIARIAGNLMPGHSEQAQTNRRYVDFAVEIATLIYDQVGAVKESPKCGSCGKDMSLECDDCRHLWES